MVNNPGIVIYNVNALPEAPKEFISVVDPKSRTLTIAPREYNNVRVDAKPQQVKLHNWLHTFVTSLQFSQAYMSENWYQGGNNNLNMISNINYGLKLNQNLHPKLLYELTVQYKLGINSAPDDELRDYSINEDLFQLVTKFGLKATKKFFENQGLTNRFLPL